MKKLLLFLCSLSLLFSACSSDDQPAPPDSQVIMDGSLIEFSTSWKTPFENDGVVGTKFTFYHVAETCGGCPLPPAYNKMELHLIPAVSNKFEGSYAISLNISPGGISGSFYISGFPIHLRSGSISITKTGGNRYKMVFDAVEGSFWQDPSRIYEFGGYFEGSFPTKEQ